MKKIRILVFLICIAMLLVQSGCSKNTDVQEDSSDKETYMSGDENNSIQLSRNDYYEDAVSLIRVLEDTHPAFALEDISHDYEQEKQQFLNSITEDTSINEFSFLVQRYLTKLNDGHTRVQRNVNTQFLDLNYHAAGDELLILNEDGSLSDKQIIELGGVSVNKVLAIVQAYFPAENDAASNLNNNIWALNSEVIKLAGCEISNNSVDITLNDNGVISSKRVEFIEKNIYECYEYSTEIESKLINDIFYIDMNICNDNKILRQQIKKLKKAIKNGTTKIIIDVRDNPGGNSMACEKLLNAMGMRAPSYGVYIRYSELAHNQYSKLPSEGNKYMEPDRTTAKSNESIYLVVLTNERTFSSATMLAVYVKDGGLGTIIGTPSVNAPSSYGDILYYKMPKTGLEVTISYKKFLRPDTEADQRILLPDIITDYYDDALETAIDYLSMK